MHGTRATPRSMSKNRKYTSPPDSTDKLGDQHEGRSGRMDKERLASVQNRQQDMLCVYTSSSFFLN